MVDIRVDETGSQLRRCSKLTNVCELAPVRVTGATWVTGASSGGQQQPKEVVSWFCHVILPLALTAEQCHLIATDDIRGTYSTNLARVAKRRHSQMVHKEHVRSHHIEWGLCGQCRSFRALQALTLFTWGFFRCANLHQAKKCHLIRD